MEAPDYSTYSLSGLRDARAHVDEERYPDRVAALDREIAVRTRDAPAHEATEATWRVVDLTKRGAGMYLVLSGVLSLAGVADATMRVGEMSSPHDAVVATFIYGVMVLAGLSVLKRRDTGLWMGVVVLYLQFPMLRIGHLLYAVTAVPRVELSIWPSLGFSVTRGAVTTLSWRAEAQPLYIGINVVAGAFAAALVEALLHRRRALQRLRARRGT